MCVATPSRVFYDWLEESSRDAIGRAARLDLRRLPWGNLGGGGCRRADQVVIRDLDGR